MKRLDIQALIAYLNTLPAITTLVSNRIFWGIPRSMQEGNSIGISEITDNIDEVESYTRLEFRIIGKDDKTTIDELYAIERAITSAICGNGKTFGDVTAYRVRLENNSATGYDEKDRQIYIRDYTFSYAN